MQRLSMFYAFYQFAFFIVYANMNKFVVSANLNVDDLDGGRLVSFSDPNKINSIVKIKFIRGIFDQLAFKYHLMIYGDAICTRKWSPVETNGLHHSCDSG